MPYAMHWPGAHYYNLALEFEFALIRTITTLRRLPSGAPDVVVAILTGMPGITDSFTISLHIDALLAKVVGIDIALISGEAELNGVQSYTIRNYAGDSVFVVAAGNPLGTHVLNVSVSFDEGGLVLPGWSASNSIALDCSVAEDAATRDKVHAYHDSMTSSLSEVQGYLEDDMLGERTVPGDCVDLPGGNNSVCGCRVAQCAAGALAADAVMWYTGADIGMINSGQLQLSALHCTLTSTNQIVV